MGLGGVELKDSVTGWRANLIQGIISSGGFYSLKLRDVFQVVGLKLHAASHL